RAADERRARRSCSGGDRIGRSDVAAYQGQRVAAAGCDLCQPLSATAGYSDVERIGHPRRCRVLVGHSGAGQDASEIIARMHAAMSKALQEPAVQRSLSEQGVILRVSTPEAFGTFIDSEITRWAKVVKDNKIVAG